MTILASSYAHNINTVFMNGLSARIGYLQKEVFSAVIQVPNYWRWNFALASITSATPFADACFSRCGFYDLAMI